MKHIIPVSRRIHAGVYIHCMILHDGNHCHVSPDQSSENIYVYETSSHQPPELTTVPYSTHKERKPCLATRVSYYLLMKLFV